MLRDSWLLLSAVCLLAGGEVDSSADVISSSKAMVHSRVTVIVGSTGLADLNLPPHLLQRIRDRNVIDAYQSRHHQVAPGVIPTPRNLTATTLRVPQLLRVVRANLADSVLPYRRQHLEPVLPHRGFIAPILEHSYADWPITLPTNRLSRPEFEAAIMVEKRLARDGLLPTLAQVVERLGATEILARPDLGLSQLRAIGFPSDLLSHFHPKPGDISPTNQPAAVITKIAKRLAQGADAESISPNLAEFVFDFAPSLPSVKVQETPKAVSIGAESRTNGPSTKPRVQFRAGTECGTEEVELLRMQMGGGWSDGIIPGGSIDVINQMVEAFRTVDFLITVEDDLLDSLRWMATNSWRLRRNGQVTIAAEPFSPSAWAQDNGKAGVISQASGRDSRLATLVPRYASIGEGRSTYAPIESYLADGLQAAGQVVIQSPLLFQGGNLLVVRDPKTGDRILVAGEGEISRNTVLGLTRDQVMRSFQEEFGVDRVAVVPGVSYHLDFDVTIRAVAGELVAFVNDTPAAVRTILTRGIDALDAHQALDASEAIQARRALATGQGQVALQILQEMLNRLTAVSNVFPASLSRVFVADPTDEAEGNLQTFLLALDILASETLDPLPTSSPARAEYLRALRRIEEARRLQVDALKQLGWRVEPIPSMPDLLRSINYLNGIQHRGGYVMPVFGGFYAALDRAAVQAMQTAVGPGVRITTIRSAECQRRFGGVHCTTVAYPRVYRSTP